MRSGNTILVDNRLNAINILFVASAIISIIGAWEISKGATLQRLNVLHLKYNNEFVEAIDNFQISDDSSQLRTAVLNIRMQPVSCLELIGPLERLAMRAAGTLGAITLCRQDITEADRVLGTIGTYASGMSSKSDLMSSLEDAQSVFFSHSSQFEPLVDRTVQFVFLTMMFLIVIKGVAVAFYGYFLSRGISNNLKELEHAKTLAQRSEERLNLAMAGTNDAIWEWDFETNMASASGHFFESLGLENPGHTDLEKWLVVHGHPEDLPHVAKSWQNYLENNKVHDVNIRVSDGKGIWQWVRIRGHLQLDQDEKPTKALGVLSNVNDLVDAQLQAESSNRSKSEFLATMSHEIRTPMNGVLGMLDSLLNSTLTQSQREKASIAHESADTLLKILNDILDYSKLETGHVELENLPVDFTHTVKSVIDLLQPKATEKGIEVSFITATTIPSWIELDPTRVRQILTNLISNAIKFTNDGHVDVTISYCEENDTSGTIRVEVSDTGIGIAEEARDRLFRRFSQVDSSVTRRFGGTGLGLAISQRLVTCMGGDIDFKSTIGSGSIFWFSIPTTTTEKAEEKPSFDSYTDLKLQPLNILIAEDQFVNQQVLKAFLSEGNHKLTIVENGKQAVFKAQEIAFDVILMDIQMPVMDGFDAANAIRASGGQASEVPIIALTANTISGTEERCFAAGMDGYISKPINPRKLLDVLQNIALHMETRENEPMIA